MTHHTRVLYTHAWVANSFLSSDRRIRSSGSGCSRHSRLTSLLILAGCAQLASAVSSYLHALMRATSALRCSLSKGLSNVSSCRRTRHGQSAPRVTRTRAARRPAEARMRRWKAVAKDAALGSRYQGRGVERDAARASKKASRFLTDAGIGTCSSGTALRNSRHVDRITVHGVPNKMHRLESRKRSKRAASATRAHGA